MHPVGEHYPITATTICTTSLLLPVLAAWSRTISSSISTACIHIMGTCKGRHHHYRANIHCLSLILYASPLLPFLCLRGSRFTVCLYPHNFWYRAISFQFSHQRKPFLWYVSLYSWQAGYSTLLNALSTVKK